jgi:hypothetical protein
MGGAPVGCKDTSLMSSKLRGLVEVMRMSATTSLFEVKSRHRLSGIGAAPGEFLLRKLPQAERTHGG